jgi:DNA-binding NtrC family response regulator
MSEEATVMREAAVMNILIVDDEPSVRETCAEVAEQSGMKTTAVATAEEALEVLEHAAVDIVLTDLMLQQTSGLDLLRCVHDTYPNLPVIVLTQYGTIDSAVAATRLGAIDYLTKPFRIEELRARLERAARAVELQQENQLRREQSRTRPGFGGIIGVSEKMQRVYKVIQKVSQHEYPVLILGERHGKGTGGAEHSFFRAAQGPHVRAGGLLVAGSHADRIGAVRPRQGRVHGRAARKTGTSGGGPRRNAVS